MRHPILDLNVHERTLANGLRVLIGENHTAPVVSIVTYVKAGYFDEPDEVVGIAHVLEHMFFKGTTRRGVGEIARETKSAGGYLNAGTIYDHTSYYTALPSSSLEMGLDIQSDALRNSVIDAEELRRELQVIIQEAKRKLDNPHAVAGESLYETMFDVHRMRRWRIGTEAVLAGFTQAQVMAFYRRFYQPSNIILAVSGDVAPEHAFDLIAQRYGDMSDVPFSRDRGPAEPAAQRFRAREIEGDILQTYLEAGWHVPGPLDSAAPGLDVLAMILGLGRASRLFRHVRDRGLVSGISAGNYTPGELGVFTIGAELQPADTAAATDAIFAEVNALRSSLVDAEELQRAKNVLEARTLRRLETVEGQANLLAEWEALGGWRLAADFLESALATTREDVRRLAAEHLDPGRATLLVYRPRSAPPVIADTAALAERLAGARPDHALIPPAAVVAPVVSPTAAPRSRREKDDVFIYALPGGAQVVVKRRSGSPLVSMAIAGRGGVLHESAADAGITGMVARVSLKGTARRSAVQIAEETESLGGSISPAVGSDYFQWGLSLPARHLRAGFDILADVALHPSVPEAELETERKVALSDLEQVRDDMYRYPMHLFFQAAFGNHPYGYALAVVEKALRVHTRERVLEWHHERVRNSELWALFVGDVDPDVAARLAASALEAHHANGRVPPAAPAWPASPTEIVELRDKAQSGLVLGFPGPDRNHPDAYALQVLANAVSGLGGRLFDELREKRSLAYTVSAYPVARLQAGAFLAYIATAPEREEEARRALLEEFERMRAVPLEDEELERARRYTIGTWQLRGQTNSAQLADLAAALMLGRGVDELAEFEARIRAVTADDVRAAANRYFDPGRMVQGIVRGTGGGR